MSVCGYTESAQPGLMCVGMTTHKGRHKMRPIAGAAVTETSEPIVVVEEIDAPEPVVVEGWSPDAGDFINLKGKAYLPARRRIQWMRGIPVPHPDWTIDTEIIEHVVGKLVKPGPVGVGRVEGGYTVVRANIFDTDSRLVATGLKSEYSENFTDYLEKAETGAIARALAVAGYGTESAIDLDEGVDAGRIADSPVEVTTRKVKLGPSSVAGVGRGGKTDGASVAQIRRVAELSRELDLSPEGLGHMIESLMGSGPTMGDSPSFNSSAIASFLSERSGDEVGALIITLEAGLPASK